MRVNQTIALEIECVNVEVCDVVFDALVAKTRKEDIHWFSNGKTISLFYSGFGEIELSQNIVDVMSVYKGFIEYSSMNVSILETNFRHVINNGQIDRGGVECKI